MVERFERFSFIISEISRYWHKIAADEMEKYGLKGPHAVYLTSLYQHDEGIHAARLCELCGKDKSDVSRMMSIMESKGLVMKCGDNSYRALLKLTDEGRIAAEHVRDRAKLAVDLAGGEITDEHRAIFYETLEHIANKLHTLSESGLPKD
jgi:DNA-binding MarR family transcriptional regulator